MDIKLLLQEAVRNLDLTDHFAVYDAYLAENYFVTVDGLRNALIYENETLELPFHLKQELLRLVNCRKGNEWVGSNSTDFRYGSGDTDTKSSSLPCTPTKLYKADVSPNFHRNISTFRGRTSSCDHSDFNFNARGPSSGRRAHYGKGESCLFKSTTAYDSPTWHRDKSVLPVSATNVGSICTIFKYPVNSRLHHPECDTYLVNSSANKNMTRASIQPYSSYSLCDSDERHYRPRGQHTSYSRHHGGASESSYPSDQSPERSKPPNSISDNVDLSSLPSTNPLDQSPSRSQPSTSIHSGAAFYNPSNQSPSRSQPPSSIGDGAAFSSLPSSYPSDQSPERSKPPSSIDIGAAFYNPSNQSPSKSQPPTSIDNGASLSNPSSQSLSKSQPPTYIDNCAALSSLPSSYPLEQSPSRSQPSRSVSEGESVLPSPSSYPFDHSPSRPQPSRSVRDGATLSLPPSFLPLDRSPLRSQSSRDFRDDAPRSLPSDQIPSRPQPSSSISDDVALSSLQSSNPSNQSPSKFQPPSSIGDVAALSLPPSTNPSNQSPMKSQRFDGFSEVVAVYSPSLSVPLDQPPSRFQPFRSVHHGGRMSSYSGHGGDSECPHPLSLDRTPSRPQGSSTVTDGIAGHCERHMPSSPFHDNVMEGSCVVGTYDSQILGFAPCDSCGEANEHDDLGDEVDDTCCNISSVGPRRRHDCSDTDLVEFDGGFDKYDCSPRVEYDEPATQSTSIVDHFVDNAEDSPYDVKFTLDVAEECGEARNIDHENGANRDTSGGIGTNGVKSGRENIDNTRDNSPDLCRMHSTSPVSSLGFDDLGVIRKSSVGTEGTIENNTCRDALLSSGSFSSERNTSQAKCVESASKHALGSMEHTLSTVKMRAHARGEPRARFWSNRSQSQCLSLERSISVQSFEECQDADMIPLYKGTHMLRVSRWHGVKRKFVKLSTDGKYLLWPSSSWLFRSSNPARKVDMSRVTRVQRGQHTVNFKYHRSKVLHCNKQSLSLMYGDDEHVDLIIESESDFDTWYLGLQKVVMTIQIANSRVNIEERFLQVKWDQADTDGNGSLSKREVMTLVDSMNIHMPRSRINSLYSSVDEDSSNSLNFEEFCQLMKKLTQRSEMIYIWAGLTMYKEPVITVFPSNPAVFMSQFNGVLTVNDSVTVDDFVAFWKRSQDDELLREDALHLFKVGMGEAFYPQLPVLTFSGFCTIMNAPFNDAYDFTLQGPYCDDEMRHPLSSFYIASSHNTYLTGNQLQSASAVNRYIDDLHKGCRCVELDCWDGDDGEPIIFHGHTITSKILFIDVIEAINEHAFKTSPYPVILSLENHCSLPVQDKMATMLIDVFGEKLVMPGYKIKNNTLPSPHDLRRKIIIKGKRDNSDIADISAYDEWDECGEQILQDDQSEYESVTTKFTTTKSKCIRTHPNLSAITYLDSINAKQLSADEIAELKCDVIVSLSEGFMSQIFVNEDERNRWIAISKTRLCRVYPSGSRVTSSNYNPIFPWAIGFQCAALNYQTPCVQMHINDGKFRENLNSGYVLKPPHLLWDITPGPIRLTIHVISGQQLPKPGGASKGEVIDPYVVLSVLDPYAQYSKEVKTKVISNNGFNPYWNEVFTFDLPNPVVSHLYIRVMDKDFNLDDFIGYCAVPIPCLTTGYRKFCIFDNMGRRQTDFEFAALFCRISIEYISVVPQSTSSRWGKRSVHNSM